VRGFHRPTTAWSASSALPDRAVGDLLEVISSD
jgi:hypothetical protein